MMKRYVDSLGAHPRMKVSGSRNDISKRRHSMKHPQGNALCFILGILFTLIFMFPSSGLATQGHSGVEGVLVHQFAHLFFVFSMGTFIYWLRKRGLVRMAGWRYLQYSALFFILWNIDAFTVHFLEEQIALVTVSKVDALQIIISAPEGSLWLGYFY